MEWESLFETDLKDGTVVPAAFIGEDEDTIYAYDHVTHEEITEWANSILEYFGLLEDDDTVEKASSSHSYGRVFTRNGEEHLDSLASKSDPDAFPITILRLW